MTKAPNGSYRITPYDPEFEKQLKIGKNFMAQKEKWGILYPSASSKHPGRVDLKVLATTQDHA